jgi:hypothetical protein
MNPTSSSSLQKRNSSSRMMTKQMALQMAKQEEYISERKCHTAP